MQRSILIADALMSRGHPMSMSNLSKLSTATTEEENPDHGEWDTDVM